MSLRVFASVFVFVYGNMEEGEGEGERERGSVNRVTQKREEDKKKKQIVKILPHSTTDE